MVVHAAMKIDTLWVSRHPDILARGYADQGMFEQILDRTLWTPPDALEFVHHEIRYDDWGKDFQDGALVILPARHHASEDDVQWFLNELDELAWSVVLLSGDEEWSFDWAAISETDTRRVTVMQPRPEHSHLHTIPGGWYPGTREGLSKQQRTHDLMFAGQVRDNSRRIQLMKYLTKMKNALIHETNGYLQGWPRDQYLAELSRSKIVPSPSGPMTVDTARPLEAMEAGCVPVLDLLTPRWESYDYWNLIMPGHPIPTVTHWGELRDNIDGWLEEWPTLSNRVFSFWQAQKRRWTLQLDSDIKAVMGGHAQSVVPDDLITVIVSTSPAPLHPSLDHLRQVISSVRAQLPNAEILIACDGVRPEDEEYRDAYTQYLADLLWYANFDAHNILPVVMDEWLHQANTVKRVLELVHTPYILFLEHDTPIEGNIPWADMCAALERPDVNNIRLHFDVELHPDHEPLHFGDTETISNVPMRRIRVFWARPHLARLDWYKTALDLHFNDESRVFTEDKLYQVLHCEWEDDSEDAWKWWGIWTYTPEGNIKRSGHLDSRAEMTKHSVTF